MKVLNIIRIWKISKKLGGISEKYIFNKAIKLLKNNDDLNILYFKYLSDRNLLGEYAKYNYARGLYSMFQKHNDYNLYIEAYKILENLTSEYEDFPLSYYLLGLININESRHLKAKIYLEKALNKTSDESSKNEIREILHQNEPKALIEKGVEYLQRANTDRAYIEFQKSKALNPKGIVNYYLAYILDRTGEEDKAKPLYEKALEDGLTNPEIYIDLANLYFKNKQISAALSVINKGLDKNIDDEQLLYNRMILNLANNDKEKAKDDYDRLLEFIDINPVILDNLLALKDNFK